MFEDDRNAFIHERLMNIDIYADNIENSIKNSMFVAKSLDEVDKILTDINAQADLMFKNTEEITGCRNNEIEFGSMLFGEECWGKANEFLNPVEVIENDHKDCRFKNIDLNTVNSKIKGYVRTLDTLINRIEYTAKQYIPNAVFDEVSIWTDFAQNTADGIKVNACLAAELYKDKLNDINKDNVILEKMI